VPSADIEEQVKRQIAKGKAQNETEVGGDTIV
jgi:hypothetical protein